jgi:hypothetical protein
MIISGIALIGLIESPYRLMLETFCTVMILGAVFSGITSYKCNQNQVPMNYHAIHALGLLVYSLALLMFAEEVTQFFDITIFYLLYYGIAELIFGLQMLLQKDKMLFNIIAIRLVIGFTIAIAAVGLYISLDQYIKLNNAIKVTGVLFILSGINLFFFKTVLLKLYQKENIFTLTDAVV